MPLSTASCPASTWRNATFSIHKPPCATKQSGVTPVENACRRPMTFCPSDGAQSFKRCHATRRLPHPACWALDSKYHTYSPDPRRLAPALDNEYLRRGKTHLPQKKFGGEPFAILACRMPLQNAGRLKKKPLAATARPPRSAVPPHPSQDRGCPREQSNLFSHNKPDATNL